ncbi:MAG: response regulator [Chitinivibrionales bacterium]|nr:response regulator [Chitinivibrionales bacterium]
MNSRKKTILVVEDDRNLIELFSLTLDYLGYDVICCGNGNEALDIFTRRNSSIDAVVLDMILPGMHGLDCLRHFKSTNPSVPVIVCTGSGLMNQESMLKECGAYEIIAKPFITGTIGQVLDKAINNTVS